MSRNILIAVDGSDNSIYAVDWSVGNFLRPGDRVFLVYVFPEYVELSQDGEGLCVPIDGMSEKTRQVYIIIRTVACALQCIKPYLIVAQAIERANLMLESLKEKLLAAKVWSLVS